MKVGLVKPETTGQREEPGTLLLSEIRCIPLQLLCGKRAGSEAASSKPTRRAGSSQSCRHPPLCEEGCRKLPRYPFGVCHLFPAGTPTRC